MGQTNKANKIFIIWLCLAILDLKRWLRARGPYGYLRTWNWPITAHEISRPYNKTTYWPRVRSVWEISNWGLGVLTKQLRSRRKFDIPVKIECSRLISILLYVIFSKNKRMFAGGNSLLVHCQVIKNNKPLVYFGAAYHHWETLILY